jgi:hypothetical protein
MGLTCEDVISTLSLYASPLTLGVTACLDKSDKWGLVRFGRIRTPTGQMRTVRRQSKKTAVLCPPTDDEICQALIATGGVVQRATAGRLFWTTAGAGPV